MGLTAGKRFPVDVGVQSLGASVTVADLLADGPLVLAFHRMWCPFCQQAARDLAGAVGQLSELGAGIAIVYREEPDEVARSCADRGLPLKCLSDTARDLERAAEVGRFSIARYGAFSPLKLITALRSGSRIGAVASGVLQGRGTFVIDVDGRVVYVHRSATAADIPPIEGVIAAVQSITESSR